MNHGGVFSKSVQALEPFTTRLEPRIVCALLLMAAYALPVFAPPPGVPALPLAPDTAVSQRLFPGVPGWWVWARLFCLLAAAVIVSRSPGRLFPGSQRPGFDTRAADVSRRRLSLALGLTAAQVVAGLWASGFNRAMQLAYVAWLAVPTFMVVNWRRVLPERGASRLRATLLMSVIVGAWLLVRVPVDWRSARAANLLDDWKGLWLLAAAGDTSFNLLTDRFISGAGTSFHLMLQGAGLPQVIGIQPSYGLAQAASFVWLAVAALAIGLLAARLTGLAAAVVTTTAFLFSPYTLMMALAPIPLFYGPLLTAGLLVLLVKVHVDRSLPALTALGALGGVAATFHSAPLICAIVLGTALWTALKRPRLPVQGLIIAMLSFTAAALTALPDLRSVPSLARIYSSTRAQWVGHEMAGFGQVSPTLSAYLVEAATPRPFDTVLGAMLAPFAVPRTPARLLGDVLFDPLGAALSAGAIAACLRSFRRSWFARVLLAVLAAAIVPASIASSDRISVNRLLMASVPMALLAGVGWNLVRRGLGPIGRSAIATGVTALSMAIGGIAVFDRINPRILASSWQAMALDTLADDPPPEGAVLLDHPAPDSFPCWFLKETVTGLLPQPITVQVFADSSSWSELGEETAPVFLWSPGLEEDQRVSEAVCQRWPGAALYTITDSAGLSRLFAARPRGPGWKPALREAEWQVEACGAVLDTEATWATGVLQQAREARLRGRAQEALALLRAGARHSFAQADLLEAAAQAILESQPDAEGAREAVQWARRAGLISQFRDPGALSTLAGAHAAAGQLGEAIQTARKAREIAAERGEAELVVDLDRRLRQYEQDSRPR